MEYSDLWFYIWFSFRIVFIGLIFIYLVSGLDDLLVDLIYYARATYRFLFKRKKIKPLTVEELNQRPEQMTAVLIPAWKEDNVIGKMLSTACSTLDYRSYRIFVGTYPNDEETRLEVERVREIHSHITPVVTPLAGPTNKADCLNWIIQEVRAYEARHHMAFQIFVLHDAEDILHPLSLKYYNYLIPRAQMIQLPVYILNHQYLNFVNGTYLDEFAEVHTKELRVRELLTSSIPSAGVGTALSRAAIEFLSKKRKNQIFNIQTLTEDYQLGIVLQELEGKKMFLQQRIERVETSRRKISKREVQKRISEPISTREFFPNSFGAAVRQKSRWILGICLQGWSYGWTKSLGSNYFLFRDRKSLLTNIAVFAGYLVVFFWIACKLVEAVRPELAIPPLIEPREIYYKLLLVVLFLFLWRILNRVYCVWRLYGVLHGFLSIPRLILGNLLNFCATCMALKRFIKSKLTGEQPAWGKTEHAFPTESQLGGFHRKLGDLLLEARKITPSQLHDGLKEQRKRGGKIGEVLVDMGMLWDEDLVFAIAKQRNEKAVEIDPFATPPLLLNMVSRETAERFRVFPLALENDTLVLATDELDRTERLKEISRRFNRPVSFRLTSKPDLDFAISRGYGSRTHPVPRALENRLGQRLIVAGKLNNGELKEAIRLQKRTRQKLGEILVQKNMVSSKQLEPFI